MTNDAAVYLMGGLGNQMFQYWHGLKLKLEGYNVKLLIDWFYLPKPANITVRTLEIHKIIKNEMPYATLEMLLNSGHKIFKEENEIVTLDRAESKSIPVKFGYFQDTAQLPPIRVLSESIIEHPKNLMGAALHLRFGDFERLGISLDREQVVSTIKRAQANERLTIYSDEPKKAEEIVQTLDLTKSQIIISTEKDQCRAFLELASYKTLFCANSSFSLAAGIIASGKGAKVYIPHSNLWAHPQDPNKEKRSIEIDRLSRNYKLEYL